MKLKKGFLFLAFAGLALLSLNSCMKKEVNSAATFGVGTGSNHQEEGRSKHKEILSKINLKIDGSKISKYYGGSNEKHNHKNTVELCLADEQLFEYIQRDVIYNLEEAYRTKNLSKLESTLTKDSNLFLYQKRINRVAKNVVEGIQEFHWSTSNKNSNKYPIAKEDLNKYLGSFKKIDDFDLSTFKFVSPIRFRNPADLSMKRAKLLARFDLRGITQNGERRNDRGMWAIDVVLQEGKWKVLEIDLLKGETLVKADAPSFVDTTKKTIGDIIPSYLRTEAIRRGGYALSISDYDGDGNHDIYVGTREEGLLLKSTAELKFKKVNVGTDGNRLVKTAIFGDFFNTGREDLVLVRFVPNHLKKEEDKTGNEAFSFSDIVFYENVGEGNFKKIDKIIENRQLSGNAMPAAIADFNGDSKLDFYIGFPGPLDFTFINGATGVSQGTQVQGLFINDGTRKKFVDRTEEGIEYAEIEYLFAHSTASVDIDQDGDMDLIVLDDRGNLSPVYLNNGKGKFTESSKKTGIVNSDLAMSLASGDVNNDGHLDFAITNVNFVAADRWSQSCSSNWPGLEYNDYAREGLRLFQGVGKGKAKFSEVTDITGLEWAGEGMAGVEFIDFNNDGLLDIYVANGLWSGTTRKQDLSSTFVRALQTGYTQTGFELTEEGTASNFMKVLAYFKGDLLAPDANTHKNASAHLAGFQRNRLFRNNGNDSFTEIGYLEGVDSIADGYIITLADLNKDGKMDMVIRNGDPGVKGVNFEPVQVLMNQNKLKRNSLVVDLEGTESNRNGIGAFVTAHIKGKSYLRHLIGNNGTAQSEKILHFGLDKNEHVDKLVVKWPSGKIQTLKNVAAGRIKIKEPTKDVRKFALDN